MAAQELRWLTYLLADLGEAPRSPPVLHVDNKAMLALCQEHRLEHRTKHIALRYFLARELQQRGQLCLAYVASQANTADVFTKALQPCDHQPCFAFLDWSSALCRGPALQLPLTRPCPAPAPGKHLRCPAAPRRLLPHRAALPSRAAFAEPCRPAEPRRTAEPHCPSACPASAATVATTATAAIAAMASPTVLTFDAEGRAVDFDVWVDDLQLFLYTVRSQCTTRVAVARLALRSHVPPAERAHFGQYKTAQDHFLSLCPTELTVDLLEECFAAAEKSILASTSLALRRSELRLPLVGGAATVRARGARVVEGTTGAAAEAVEEAEGVAVEVGVVPGVGASVAVVEVVEAAAEVVEAAAAVVEAAAAMVEVATAVWYAGRGRSGGAGPCTYILRTGSRHGETCRLPHTAQHCFGRLTNAWRAQFRGAVQLPRWHDRLRQNVAIFDLDFDAILAAMYALTDSAEGDCYLSVPPDPGIEAAALGASASAAPGTGESAAPCAGESALSGTAPTEALHTFTLDSGASRSFFRNSTTLTPLSRPVAVSLADPSGGPILAHSSTVLPCPAAPSGLLSGLHLHSFSTKMASGADLQDAWVDQFAPGGQRVTHCTCSWTGRHLATLTRRPRSSLYTLTTASPPVSASGQVAASSQVFAAASRSSRASAPSSCRPLSHETLLWHHRLGHPSLPRLRGMASCTLVSGLPRSLPPLPPGPAPTCVPCVEGRQRATPHSSSFPPTEAPLQTLHMDMWGPARVRGQGHERYFLLVVDDYSRYTTVFPLRSKGEVPEVLIDWIRGARFQLSEHFGSDLPVLRLHSNRGGDFSSDLLSSFYRAEGIRQTLTLPSSLQQNGIAERRIGMPASPLPGPSPYYGPTRGLTERREPESRPVSPESRPASPESRSESPICTVRASRHVSRPRPPPVPGTHSMTLRPSTAPQRVPLLSPPASSFPHSPDPESDSLHATSPTVMRFLATTVTEYLFESTAASALVAELVDFAAACRQDFATSLVAESASASVCPPSVGGECALGTDVLEDRQEDFECFATAIPPLLSMLLVPEGDPDAPDIPTPRSYAEAIEGPYSSQWQAAMDTDVDEVPPPGANIVSGMWIFRVKRPPGSPPVFKARYVARGFSQRQGVDFFHTFSPTPKMTTLRVLLHVAAQRDYEVHSLDFSTAFLQGSLHEEIWLRRPPGFTGSFPAGTQWSLRRPAYGLCQASREWHDTVRTTLAAIGFAPSTFDPSLYLRTDTTLPPFYVLVYVDDLVFATADTEALAHVKSELQKRHTCTDLGELTSYLGLWITRDRAQRTITLTQSHMVQQVLQRFGFTYSSPQSTPLPTGHSLSAPPSDESVEPSGPYPELVGCLMYLMTCTRPDLAYPLSILARYVAPGLHRKVHGDAMKRVLCYLCSTSGMGLVLGGRARVVLTGHADASWVDDSATQRLSQGYTLSLGSGSVSWRSTRSPSVLSSSCEAEIYAGAMAAQELRWLTYLLTDLGETPRSPPVLYVDNKAMLALCQEHRLEHRTKHIALRYFLARELQQRGQLRLAYVASQANTADVFTKAL
ncbi:unnamed protein product [Closterium sp. NIES-53]